MSLNMSSAIYSQNFKTVCIQWLPLDKNGDIQHTNSQNDNLIHKISKKNYPVSGIYQFNSKLLWEIKDEIQGDCRPLDDGHAIFFENDKFSLMKDGRLIRKFTVKDFCKDPAKMSFEDLEYSGRIDEDKKEFEFKACGKIYNVDIASGKILEKRTYSFFIGLVLVAFLGLEFVGLWKTFEKGNYPGLFSLIPLYNAYVLVVIAGLSPWILLLFSLPGVNLLLSFFIHFKLARKFQFGFITSIFLAVFYWIILYPIIGFGNSIYEDEKGAHTQ